MPATSTGLPRFHFLLQPLTVLIKQTRQAVCAIKQSILLRCLWLKVLISKVILSIIIMSVNYGRKMFYNVGPWLLRNSQPAFSSSPSKQQRQNQWLRNQQRLPAFFSWNGRFKFWREKVFLCWAKSSCLAPTLGVT